MSEQKNANANASTSANTSVVDALFQRVMGTPREPEPPMATATAVALRERRERIELRQLVLQLHQLNKLNQSRIYILEQLVQQLNLQMNELKDSMTTTGKRTREDPLPELPVKRPRTQTRFDVPPPPPAFPLPAGTLPTAAKENAVDIILPLDRFRVYTMAKKLYRVDFYWDTTERTRFMFRHIFKTFAPREVAHGLNFIYYAKHWPKDAPRHRDILEVRFRVYKNHERGFLDWVKNTLCVPYA